jgi:hypothetical protein
VTLVVAMCRVYQPEDHNEHWPVHIHHPAVAIERS